MLSTTDLYFQDVQAIVHLSPEKEQLLFVTFHAGGADAIEARNEIIEAHMPLVAKMASQPRYRTDKLSLLDLIQEGNLALHHAVNSFDSKRGTRFSTYARYAIKQAIIRTLTEQAHSIRLPMYAQQQLNQLRKARRQLEATQSDPSLAEIAKKAEVPLSQAMILQKSRAVQSLEALTHDPAEQRLQAPSIAISDLIRAQIATLTLPERIVLQLRYGYLVCPLTSAEKATLSATAIELIEKLSPTNQLTFSQRKIGAAFGWTRAQVQAHEARALSKLRRSKTLKLCL